MILRMGLQSDGRTGLLSDCSPSSRRSNNLHIPTMCPSAQRNVGHSSQSRAELSFQKVEKRDVVDD